MSFDKFLVNNQSHLVQLEILKQIEYFLNMEAPKSERALEMVLELLCQAPDLLDENVKKQCLILLGKLIAIIK